MKKNKRLLLIWMLILIVICILNFIQIHRMYIKERQEFNYIVNLDSIYKTSDFELSDNSKETKVYEQKTIWNYNSDNDTQKWLGDVILSIPDIQLKKVVYSGKKRIQHLENYELITATNNMKYKNGGNYIICGHASRLYGHSFNRLKEMKKNMKIYIITKTHTDKYVVTDVFFPNMYATNEYCNQTQESTLTIVSCAKYVSKKSYIVVHAKKVN